MVEHMWPFICQCGCFDNRAAFEISMFLRITVRQYSCKSYKWSRWFTETDLGELICSVVGSLTMVNRWLVHISAEIVREHLEICFSNTFWEFLFNI